jgi:hypothetical protein
LGKKRRKSQQARSPTPTPTRWTKVATPYLINKKKNGKVIAIKSNKQANKGKGAKRIWVPKEIISNMKSTKNVWVPREKFEGFGEFGVLAKMGCISWDASYQIKSIAKWVSDYYGPKFPTHE